MATKHIRDLVSFTHQSDYEIVEIAGAVIMGLTGNKNQWRKAGSSLAGRLLEVSRPLPHGYVYSGTVTRMCT